MKTIAKLVVASVLAGMALSGQAKNSYCGYKDFFHLNEMSNPLIHIISANSDADVYLQVIGPRSFQLRDAEFCDDGYAHVTVALDNNNWCVLNVKDGPFMNHPIIYASCNGLRYRGFDYDGIGTFSYTLNID